MCGKSTLTLLFPAVRCAAQLPDINDLNGKGRKVAFRPFLGRISSYNEILGLGSGQSVNIEGSPLMTDLLTLNLRVGVGTPYLQAPSTNGLSLIYSISTEFGRRRSRLIMADATIH